jgi:hypothetical protein
VAKVIAVYAASFESMTDELAERLISEAVAIEADRARLMQAYLPRLNQVLPARKVARYIQIENKIRGVINFELAA